MARAHTLNTLGPSVYATLAWAALAALLAVNTTLNTNDDAQLLVGAISIIGVCAAVAAARAFASGRLRLAAVLLIVSAVTPSGFAYLPNLVALVCGLAILTRTVVGPERSGPTPVPHS